MQYNPSVLSIWNKLTLKAIEKYSNKLSVQYIEFSCVKYIAGGYDEEEDSTIPPNDFRKEFKITLTVGPWFNGILLDNIFSKILLTHYGVYINPKYKDMTDFAINRKFKVYYMHGLTYGDFDIIDVEPGHSMQEAEFADLAKRYWIVQTENSYHLYPRTDVENVDIFGDNGGRVIQDSEWTKGFIRFTESPNKGELKLLNP